MSKPNQNLTRLIYRLVVLPMVVTCFSGVTLVNPALPATVATAPPQTLKGDNGEEGYRRALNLLKQDKTAEALPLLEAAWRTHPDNAHMLANYLSALVWLGLYDKAINLYATHKNALAGVKYLYRNMAKAFYETKDYRQALTLYNQACSFDNSDAEALKGLIFCAVKLQDYPEAVRAWLTAYQKKTIPIPSLTPLRIYLMRQVGANTLALQYAQALGSKDQELIESLKGDVAAERIKWDEYDAAILILEQQLQDNPDNFRARCDCVVALKEKYRMKEVLDQYRIIEKSGRPAPYWVTESVADALLYLKRPREAARFYQLRLEQNPEAPFSAYMGLYLTYTELRDWDEADKTWDRIDDLLKHRKLNFVQKDEAFEARGWYLIYQDKLKEAQDYFDACLREAGLYSGYRTGLGHAYYFRGWPRQAMEQFKIAQNVAPEDVATRVGEAMALDMNEEGRFAGLNSPGYKYEARALADELYRKYPYDLHVQDLHETLRVEDLPLIWGDMRFINEWPGVTELRFRGGVTANINPVFQVFTNVLHMHSSETTSTEKYVYSWDRVGLGFNWIVLPSLTLTQSASSDYLEHRDLGSYTKLAWQATEGLKVSGSFDSFSLDLPIRAQATGVHGKTAMLDLDYHESDLREYTALFTSNWLSDGNYNPEIVLGAEQNVINNPDWKLRLGPEFYYGRYTKSEDVVPYFSPNFEYSLALKPILEIIPYHVYDTKLVSKIIPEVGLYKEAGFGFYPIAGIAWEQEIWTSKTFWIKWSVAYNEKVYDGVYTNVLEAFLSINKKF